MKIGFLMASLDPIHIGHIATVTKVLNEGLCDKVYVVPTVHNPWKEMPIGSFDERCDMVLKSLAWVSRVYPRKVYLERIEETLSEPYYSCYTLQKLYKKYGQGRDGEKNELFIIGGADTINSVTKWMHYEDMIKPYFKFIGFTRGDIEIANDEVEYKLVESDAADVSSTLVRELAKDGKCVFPYVSESIVDDVMKIYG